MMAASDRDRELKIPMMESHRGSNGHTDPLELRSREEKLDDPPTGSLPPPNTASSAAPSSGQAGAKKIHPAVIIAIWISLSSTVIVYNKYILDKNHLNFGYPITLTTWHLFFATVGTRVLQRTTRLLDGLGNVQMSWDRYVKNIVPIGALFSASLIFNNMAYLTLSVSFIQMLKAFTSVAVLGMSVFMGLESPSQRTLVIVLFISCGVALASYGEVKFVMSGFVCQALGITFEACRLVTIQKLLHGMKMDPLVSLYYFAPVCAGINALLIPLYEGTAPFAEALDKLGLFVLFTNAGVAFCLNIAVVFLIGAASSLVLTLSGVLKDILLVGVSVILFGSPVTRTQLFGYGIALAGLVVFKTKKEVFDEWVVRARTRLGIR